MENMDKKIPNNITSSEADNTTYDTVDQAAFSAAGNTAYGTADRTAFDKTAYGTADRTAFGETDGGTSDSAILSTAGSTSKAPAGKHRPGKPAAILAGIAALSLLGSCLLSLADVPLAQAARDSGEARLAGLYITTDYIEPGSPEIDVDSMGNISIKEPEPTKIYGIVNDPGNPSLPPVTFPGLEGFGIYCLRTQEEASLEPSNYYTGDALLTDLHFTSSDEEEHAEASLYVKAGQSCRYYYNPVYQQEDGALYLVPGNGISSDSLVPGVKWSQSIAQSLTRRSQDTEETESYRFTVKIIAEEAPGGRELFFLDSGNQVLRSLSGAELEALLEQKGSLLEQKGSRSEQASDRLKVPAGTAYLILCQETAGNAEPVRTLFDYGSEYLEYKTLEENGCLLCHQISLDWEASR